MTRRHLWPLAFYCIVLSACGDSFGPDLSDLDRARSKWNAAKLSQYEFDYIQHCGECAVGYGVVYQVRVFSSGTVTMTNNQSGADAPDYVERPTVPAMFARIEMTLRDHPNTFFAEYDAALGYPTGVSVDPIKNAIDDEWGLSVSALKAF